MTFIAISRILCEYFIGAGRLFDFIVSLSVCLSVSLLGGGGGFFGFFCFLSGCLAVLFVGGGGLISFLEILTIGEKISLII